ncbi:peptidase M61 [Reichenbachiella carrageenanivorans]|uniref:Peptidase M61 n=1 Tax=Reichenbachiella carrageenanivorans TaxID=2979869 RepID=A0ABY6D4X9_9BACT|nr:peptidase M61 [Reichenbachiella carrageenanivorans]UXX81191.1 peptidase M61 [Reichenbachiella carrageenanivorans]
MNLKVSLLVVLMGLSASIFAQEKYEISVDLNQVVGDRVQVTCLVPTVAVDEIEFRMPKIVPGTYSISDFGRFILDFKAYDTDGGELETEVLSDNRRLIKNSGKLHTISYWVDDTFDSDQEQVIFEPAGTNIQEGKNFVINTFGFFGYLEGMKDYSYELKVDYPAGMYGASALDKVMVNDSSDVFMAANYFDLADGPIMYAVPDTATFIVGGAEILISIYSPNKVLDPIFVKEQIEPTLEAQSQYLGELPVDKYAFIIYLFDTNPMSGKMGALEHSYSSFYSLPEVDPFRLAQVIRDVAAHEFFHILTPLNIHSEEIGDFDFINPKMSKHLWMYEGTTEYAAGLAQVKYGEMSLPDYLEVISGKIHDSKTQYDDTLSFTELSLHCLDQTAAQYGNVYQKGALIGMALDIQLRELSGGQYGLQELMHDLAKKYGKTASFKDDTLFDTITALTYPEVRSFFASYVEGTTPIPYDKFLAKVGVAHVAATTRKELSLGHISFSVNDEDNRLVIQSIDQMNTFGQEMGYEEGDIIYQFDKVDIDIENYEEEFMAFTDRHEAGDKISAVVLRTDENGKTKKIKLKAKAVAIDRKVPATLELMEEPTQAQLALRKAWVNK